MNKRIAWSSDLVSLIITNINMKKVLPIIILLILIGGGAFYGGMEYAKSKGGLQNLQNLSTEERQEMFQEMGANIGSGLRGGRPMGQIVEGFANGEIIAKGEESITIKLRDGGSRIIFFSESTDITITKPVSGSVDDLKEGQQVMISGKENSDGSYTAQTIQMSKANTSE